MENDLVQFIRLNQSPRPSLFLAEFWVAVRASNPARATGGPFESLAPCGAQLNGQIRPTERERTEAIVQRL